ncbi:hypothetical protein GDO78_005934 [Eleutherodactylus coqui]|uniref:Uncharacterized protein n=1 Tax=Eleutherodactylus coqui TaxID=57060 RepID=A0A8J6KET4_ELECQ|nr:hypothetical protein GDO78_005934 [Eleutherodactylus coqui]
MAGQREPIDNRWQLAVTEPREHRQQVWHGRLTAAAGSAWHMGGETLTAASLAGEMGALLSVSTSPPLQLNQANLCLHPFFWWRQDTPVPIIFFNDHKLTKTKFHGKLVP